MAIAPNLELNDGHSIPQIGWGVMAIDSLDLPGALASATKAGYRSIDTAQAYGNEDGVGEAVRRSDVPRDDLFITTKLANAEQGYDSALRAFDGSLERLGVETVDLFLIHWPAPAADRYVQTWKALEAIRASGRASSIGVSNFTERHLQRLFDETDIVPVLNQVELHPRFQQGPLRAFHAEHHIITEAWSPLERGRGMLEESGQTHRVSLLDEPVITTIATDLGKTPAQVVLRWHVQLGNVVVPKSSNPQRMAENIDLFDFALSDGQMADMASLDGNRIGPDPETMNVMFGVKAPGLTEENA